jgi:hypothetical protein
MLASGGGTGFVGCHTTAALVGHDNQVSPGWRRAFKERPCPSSPPDGQRRPPARARAPPVWQCTTRTHQPDLFRIPKESKMTAIPIPTPTSVLTELNTAVAT